MVRNQVAASACFAKLGGLHGAGGGGMAHDDRAIPQFWRRSGPMPYLTDTIFVVFSFCSPTCRL
jgi:hypothetical protein